MRNILKGFAVGSLLLLGATACADLEVLNENAPDAVRSLATAGDVESLISGAYNTWWKGHSSRSSSGNILSNQAFQNNGPYNNQGMDLYGAIPRAAIDTDTSLRTYGNIAYMWIRSYRALASVADGLRAIEDNPAIAEDLGPDRVAVAKAFGKFVQGMAHGSVAMLFDQGFVVDETTDLNAAQEPIHYNEVMTAALAYLDEAISMAQSGGFDLPWDWMRPTGKSSVSNTDFIEYMHSWKARYRAQVARTPAERTAVNWSAVIADVDAGIQEDFWQNFDYNAGWYWSFIWDMTMREWTQLSYWIYGMADQSGVYQQWAALPFDSKSHTLPDGTRVLINTPDQRFPQGATLAEQRADVELRGQDPTVAYFRVVEAARQGDSWKKPERGTWRWSWYKVGFQKGPDYWGESDWDKTQLRHAEMRLLKAEGLYRGGAANYGAVADIINETRVLHGLDATDASSKNDSGVPRLHDGTPGDLWEMLKWEARMETYLTGLNGSTWWYNSRGWGDLFKGTPLQWPIPCKELEVLQMLPCYTFGGVGGDFGAPTSSYAYPFEG